MALLNITGFPDEILTLVCTEFCFHCSRSEEDDIMREMTDDEWQGRQTLTKLCRTSKRLRHIAQPILYHQYDSSWKQFKGLQIFLRTIVERPDLARHVRSAKINLIDPRMYDTYSPVLSGPMKASVERLGLTIPANITKGSLFPMYHTIAQLIIAQLQRLEHLKLDLPSCEKAPEKILWVFNQLAKETPSPKISFPHLRKVAIHEEQPRVGFRPLTLEALSGFFSLAPNLESVTTLYFYGSLRPGASFPMRNIVELCLTQTRHTLRQLEPIFSSCGSLQKFRYDSDYDAGDEEGEITPRQMVESLLRFRSSLRWLRLRFSGMASRDEKINSFTEFSKLETLKIDARAFGSFREELDHDILVKALPQVVQDLEILCVFGGEADSIEQIAKNRDLFRNLHRVTVDGDFEALSSKFEMVGIEFRLFETDEDEYYFD